MSADRPEIDATPLLGDWLNTNPDTGQIADLRVRAGDGGPELDVRGVGRASRLEWGPAPIERLYRGGPGSTAASAFEARYDFDRMTALLEANVSKGLLIVACLKTFRDGSGRSDYFVREFFRRGERTGPFAPAPVDRGPRPATCADDDGPAVGSEGLRGLDPGLYLGRWLNTDPAARGVREVRFGGRDGGMVVALTFAEGPRPGETVEVAAGSFADRVSGTSATQFHAELDRPGERIRMHGWVKLGVLVIALFRRPDDSAAFEPWFDREFFYRADRP